MSTSTRPGPRTPETLPAGARSGRLRPDTLYFIDGGAYTKRYPDIPARIAEMGG
jgi:hypothetical protein